MFIIIVKSTVDESGTCTLCKQSGSHSNPIDLYQAPDSETSLTPVFLSSTCFRQSGAAQQQLGFLNFTSGSI